MTTRPEPMVAREQAVRALLEQSNTRTIPPVFDEDGNEVLHLIYVDGVIDIREIVKVATQLP